MTAPVWPSPCCAPYFPPSSRNPLPYPQPTQTDGGGYLSPAFTTGFDVATPPFPSDHRSRIPAMPPAPSSSDPQPDTGGFETSSFSFGFDIAAPLWPLSSPPPGPPLPGYCRAGDPCSPQRSDTEVYRRAVFLGLITPTSLPAVGGVAVDAPTRRDEALRQNEQTTHSPDYTQIHEDSWDFDHRGPHRDRRGSFSEEFG